MKRNTKVWSGGKKAPLRLATVFSGIGAIEQALLRMHIDHEIVFACDNGDQTKQRKYTFFELFARCGGLSLGMEQAGFTPVFANEIRNMPAQTYLHYRRSNNV